MASRPITEDDVITTARLYSVPPALALAVWEQESGRGTNTKTSSKGAVGGFQVRPGTFKDMVPNGDIYNPVDNMIAGIKYLAYGLKRSGGDPQGALQVYYHGSPLKPGERGPTSGPGTPDTLAYSEQALARMQNNLARMGPSGDFNRGDVPVNTQPTNVASLLPRGIPGEYIPAEQGALDNLYGDQEDVTDSGDDEDVEGEAPELPTNLGLYGGQQMPDVEEPMPDIAGLTRPLDTGNTDWLDKLGSTQDFELDNYVRKLVDEEFANRQA